MSWSTRDESDADAEAVVTQSIDSNIKQIMVRFRRTVVFTAGSLPCDGKSVSLTAEVKPRGKSEAAKYEILKKFKMQKS
jgi:hypothetical protein